MSDNKTKCQIDKEYGAIIVKNTSSAIGISLILAAISYFITNIGEIIKSRNSQFALGGGVFLALILIGVLIFMIYDNIQKRNDIAKDFINKSGKSTGNDTECDKCFLYSKDRVGNLIWGWGVVILCLGIGLFVYRTELEPRMKISIGVFLLSIAVSFYTIYIQGQNADDRKYYTKDENETPCSTCLDIKDKAGLYFTNAIMITILGILWAFWKRSESCKLNTGFNNLYSVDMIIIYVIIVLVITNLLSVNDLNDKANKLKCKEIEIEEKYKHIIKEI